MMRLVHEYARQWRFEVNHAKCGLMRFNVEGSVLPTEEVLLGERMIPWVAIYKYLGVEVENNPGHRFRSFRSRLLSSARRASCQIGAMGMYSGKLPVPIGVEVYRALVRSLLEYSAEVTSILPWHEAEELQISVAKRILQCSYRTTNVAALGELGWQTLEARYRTLRLGFYGKILKMNDDIPAKRIYQATREYVEFYPADLAVESKELLPHSLTLWCTQIHRDLITLGMENCWTEENEITDPKSSQPWKDRVKIAVGLYEQRRWKCEMQRLPKLDTYRLMKRGVGLQMEEYLSVPHGGWNDRILLGRQALTRIRTGTNELRIETGRWEGLPRDQRICSLCARETEDEKHFLLRCPNFHEQRTALYQSLDRCVNEAESEIPAEVRPSTFHIAELTEEEQLLTLTGNLHQRIRNAGVGQRILSMILIALPGWLKTRKEQLTARQQERANE